MPDPAGRGGAGTHDGPLAPRGERAVVLRGVPRGGQYRVLVDDPEPGSGSVSG